MVDRLPDRRAVARFSSGSALVAAVRVIVAASLLIVLVGCDLFTDYGPGLNPSVVGVIENSENVGGVWHYRLANGESLKIDYDEPVTPLEGALGGGDGALLFYGDGEDPWYFVLERYVSQDPAGSFRFENPAVDDDTHIIFENGLRLPKAAGFEGNGWPQDGRYYSPAGEAGFAPFCINERGEVTAYLAMPSDQHEGCPDAM